MPSYDAVVIGAGHNGLVAATLLAKSRFRVLVVEAASTVGGMAKTVEFAPGFRVSHVAHLLTHLDRRLAEQLSLDSHGLGFAATGLPTVALAAAGQPLKVAGARVFGDLPAEEEAAWGELNRKLGRFAVALRPFLSEVPPKLGGKDRAASLQLGRLGFAIRRLGKDDMREFLRMLMMPVADIAEDELTDDRLRGLLAFDATLGQFLGPRSPGSVFSLIYRLAGEQLATDGGPSLPRGGMGAVGSALALAAVKAGVEIRLVTRAERILVKNGRAVGVQLAGGEAIAAGIVVSAANAKSTLLNLVGGRNLETDTVRRAGAIRQRGVSAKLHLALKSAPRWLGVADGDERARLVIAPSVDAIEAGFNTAKYGELPADPVMEVIVPTLFDQTLAPATRHVLSAIVQYVPANPGVADEAARRALLERCLLVLERHAPGLRNDIVATELLLPTDLEQRYLAPGGHWHHGELTIDQMFSLRPFQLAAQYEVPLDGLYLCGAGNHPGGGVMGLAGANAVTAIRRIEAKK